MEVKTGAIALHLLGAPRLEREGVAMPVERRKALALLAYLALTGIEHRRETLASLFWPEAEPTEARAALRRALSVLNTTLDGSILDVQRDTVAVRAGDLWLDVAEFRRLVHAATTEAGQLSLGTIDTLTEAVALYRGDFMSGFSLRDSPDFDDWQFQQSESLRRELAQALEQLAQAHAAHGDYRAALEPARRWVALDPLHEPAHRTLMKLYAWDGQTAAAVRVYQECVRVLEVELGASPEPETARLYEAIRAGQVQPPVPRRAAAYSRLPQALETDRRPPLRAPRAPVLPAQTTPLLGRVDELAQMNERLADASVRLLTVVGPGGSGKTRLALQAAANYGARTGSPIYFVALAAAPAPENLVGAISEALGVAHYEQGDATAQLFDALRDQALILLLDNFEHLLSGAGLLADILAQAPNIKLLVTSRERLHLHGEWVMELEGLSYPPSAHTPNIDFYEAVQLFVHSARRARADFVLDETARPGVVEICRLVQGLPLGLELAAPWVRMLSVGEIAAEMTRDLDFLSTARRDVPERHRSLRAAFEHSWRLLEEAERKVLAGLSVFRGPFLRAAGEQVAGATLPILAALADKSLLRALPPRHSLAQYELHDLVRQFASEKLRADPVQARQAQQQHAHYYAAVLSRRHPVLPCEGWDEALFTEVATEIENVRLAWSRMLAQADLAAIQSAQEGLFKFYLWQAWYQEGRDAFAAAIRRIEELAAISEQRPVLALLGTLLGRQAVFTTYLGQPNEARQLFQRSLELLAQHGDAADLTFMQMRAGLVAREIGDYAQARRLLEASLEVSRVTGRSDLLANTLSYLGYFHGEVGEFEAASRLLAEGLAVARAEGLPKELASALNNWGYVSYLAGDLEKAENLLQESLALRRAAGHPHGVAVALDNLGYVALAAGDRPAARARFLEALALAQSMRFSALALDLLVGLAALLPLPNQAPRAVELITLALRHHLTWQETKDRAQRWLSERAALLSPDELAAAQARGQALSLEDVVAGYLKEREA